VADCKETIEKRLEGTEYKIISIDRASDCLTFGIDFDGTFAADPELFRCIIKAITNHHHKVVFVTGRDESRSEEVRDLIGRTFGSEASHFSIVFAGAKWKKEAAVESGYNINIWIDDNPEYIGPQVYSQQN
jgi:hypothetical protein